MSKTKRGFKKLISDKEKLKEAVLGELCKMAFDDIGAYIEISDNQNGEQIVSYKAEDLPTENIAEITKNKNGMKIKLYNKENALIRLGMYLGLWKEKPEEADAEDLFLIEDMLKEE